jgi:hypothetical protein
MTHVIYASGPDHVAHVGYCQNWGHHQNFAPAPVFVDVDPFNPENWVLLMATLHQGGIQAVVVYSVDDIPVAVPLAAELLPFFLVSIRDEIDTRASSATGQAQGRVIAALARQATLLRIRRESAALLEGMTREVAEYRAITKKRRSD